MRCNKDTCLFVGLLLWYWILENHTAHWIPVKMRPLLCREKDTPGYCKYWCFLRTPLESLERSLISLPLEYPEVENVLWHTYDFLRFSILYSSEGDSCEYPLPDPREKRHTIL